MGNIITGFSLKKSINRFQRLRLGSDFRYVREHGFKLARRLLVLVTAETADDSLKFGVICGRKFSTKAVDRNRARRLAWESFRLIKANILPCHVIIIPRREIMKEKQQVVQAELIKLLIKAGKWRHTASDSARPE